MTKTTKTFVYYADKAEHFIDARLAQRTEAGKDRVMEIARIYTELAKAAPKE